MNEPIRYTHSATLLYIMYRECIEIKELRDKLGMKLSRIREIIASKSKLTTAEKVKIVDEFRYMERGIES